MFDHSSIDIRTVHTYLAKDMKTFVLTLANSLTSVQTTEYRFYKSEGRQTSIIHYSSHNLFQTNSVAITTTFNIYTTCRVAHPSRAGTTKHAYKTHQTKQGTTPGRGQRLPCEVEMKYL